MFSLLFIEITVTMITYHYVFMKGRYMAERRAYRRFMSRGRFYDYDYASSVFPSRSLRPLGSQTFRDKTFPSDQGVIYNGTHSSLVFMITPQYNILFKDNCHSFTFFSHNKKPLDDAEVL